MSGSYGLSDADGRVRTVNYVADEHGYRASISTNEPGTDVKQDPAAANFNLGEAEIAAVPVAAPVALAGPAPLIGHAIAAPIATSYAMTTQHIAEPLLKSYAAAPIVANYGLNKFY